MAIPRDNDLVTLGPWRRGANNIAREDSVPGTSFRRGVNVDVMPDGKVRRRKGMTVIDPTPLGNLWSDGSYALATSLYGDVLYRVIPGAPLPVLYTGLQPEADVAYCSVNDLVYVTDGVRALRVSTHDDSVRPWSVPTPAGQPVLSVVAGGLAPGVYQVVQTYTTADGEESGAGLAAYIDLPDGGGIHASAPAFPVPAHVHSIELYVTRAGGGEFLHYGRYTVGTLDAVITRQPLGRPLRTAGMQPLAVGRAAGLVGGRLVVVVDNMLVVSEPLRFGLMNFAKNYIPYPAAVDMFAPTALGARADGVFVAAGDKTYFLEGADPLKSGNRLAYASGAGPGTPTYVSGDSLNIEGVPSQPVPIWLAKNGYVVIGLPNGQVRALTDSRYAMDVGTRVVMASRELEGVEQLLIGTRAPTTRSKAVSADSATTTLVRNGVAVD